MGSLSRSDGDRLAPDVVFDALDDETCRTIVSALDSPMTARQIADEADVPISTTYKKLEKLTNTPLLTEETELHPRGHHRSLYFVDFERIVVRLDQRHEFAVDVEPKLAEPERQLIGIWSEMRKET